MTTITVVEGLIFCISATPHLGTSFPLFHGAAAAGAGQCSAFIVAALIIAFEATAKLRG